MFHDFFVAGALAFFDHAAPPATRPADGTRTSPRPPCGWQRPDCRDGARATPRARESLPGAHPASASEIPSGQISTGRAMPKIPGSREVCDDNTIVNRLRVPAMRSSRRRASTSRPSRNGAPPQRRWKSVRQRTHQTQKDHDESAEPRGDKNRRKPDGADSGSRRRGCGLSNRRHRHSRLR